MSDSDDEFVFCFHYCVCVRECVVGIKEVVGIFWATLGCAGIKYITWFSADDILISHLLFVSATHMSYFLLAFTGVSSICVCVV